jgi:phytoene/squalene synthetase
MLEPSLGLGVAAERRVVVSALGHRLLQRGQLVLDGHQLRRAGEDVVAQGEVTVAWRALIVQRHLGALAQHELAEVDRRLAGEHPQQRRLARPVAARQGHAVAALELEGDAAQQRLSRDVLAEV